jgi:heme oxygenase
VLPELNGHPDTSDTIRRGAPPSPRWALRSATAAAHERLDTLYSRLDLRLSDDYARFLTSQAATFIPVEAALAAAGAEAVFPGWSDRRRADSLRADLAYLGLATPPPAPSPLFEDDDALLGGLYVLEGSRLGAAVLAGDVAAGSPNAFLRPETPAAWRAFTALLDHHLTSDASIDRAAAAANAVFAVFELSASAVLEPRAIAE